MKKLTFNVSDIFGWNYDFICSFNSINTTAHYLCCSSKIIQRAIHISWIYIPNVFIPYLNNHYLNNNNDIISSINNNNNKFKYKSGLINKEYRTKIKISTIYK